MKNLSFIFDDSICNFGVRNTHTETDRYNT